MQEKQNIVVVWFKRDLRLHDNEAIHNAINTGKRILLLYLFEPILENDPHYSERHWNFIKESIVDLNLELQKFNSKVLTVRSDLFSAFNLLQDKFKIEAVFSHQETGILTTFERDKAFKRYCKNNLIEWKENINNGVLRGLKNRESWFDHWTDYMTQKPFSFVPKENQLLNSEEIHELEKLFDLPNLETPMRSSFQKGGTKMAWEYAKSFISKRHHLYMFNISKPEKSRSSCSRLSPYLAWGNVSVREIYQKSQEAKTNSPYKNQLSAFASRLRWQAHFIQKFEMEHTMEHASVNKGFHKLKKRVSEEYQLAWKEGKTGFPLVDASMRCLKETGYINFRMRAMLVSFFTHILWQPWQDATVHLSQLFLDFEPGIHFPQIQMQAGETGINNLRIYNPVKNALEHDPDAIFIKKWVPELAHLETPFALEPWLMTSLEQQLYNFELGKDYPFPIVDIITHRKRATDMLWKFREDYTVKKENLRILQKHTISNRKQMLNSD